MLVFPEGNHSALLQPNIHSKFEVSSPNKFTCHVSGMFVADIAVVRIVGIRAKTWFLITLW